MLHRAPAFDNQGGDCRFLKCQRNIGDQLVIKRLSRHCCGHGGFEPRKAEIEAGPVGHRPRKFEYTAFTLPRPARNRWATGVAQPQQLGGLVERLAHGIVQRFTENGVVSQPAYVGDQGMAAGNQQRQKREFRFFVFQHRRQQVSFHVVHADGRYLPAPGQSTPQRGTDEQGAGKPRAAGVGDTINIRSLDLGLFQHGCDQGQALADMVSRGQFRHNAAIIRVYQLGIELVRQQAPLGVINRHTGIVAGGFESKNHHGAILSVAIGRSKP